MNKLKQTFGLLWMVIGVAAIGLLVAGAATHIGTAKGDAGKPLPWLIIIGVFTPVAVGLVVFGWYAWKGEYGAAEQTAFDKFSRTKNNE